jgi:hypothetical protein
MLSCGLPFERIHGKINTETEDFATNLHAFLACPVFPATLD